MKVIPCLSVVHLALANEGFNPITRVANLMQKLADDVKKAGKEEDKLNDTFKCWCEQVQKNKDKTIAAAQVEVTRLTTYISDLDGGRIELTDERARLEKEQKAIKTDLESLRNNRDQQEQEYKSATDEVDKTIKALEEASKFLGDAIKGNEKGVLASMNVVLSKVLQDSSVTEEDAELLNRLSQVPEHDWNKLNRKATFKGKYKARSQKINALLKKMLATFRQNKVDLDAKEAENKSTFEELEKTKAKELSTNEQALLDMTEENGARGKSKREAQKDLDTHNDNIKADNAFKATTKKTCEEKATEFEARVKNRQAEVTAIMKAIYILRNDDARDLFKRSLTSQAPTTLLQRGPGKCSAKQIFNKAFRVLRSVAKETDSSRLSALAIRAHLQTHKKEDFSEVVQAIDSLLADLKAEYDKDLADKEDCQAQQVETATNAKTEAREMDKNNAAIESFNGDIATAEQQIKDAEDRISELEEALRKATAQRKKEQEFWEAADKDDKDAAETVKRAYAVLENQYATLNSAPTFVSTEETFDINAGDAPPPPPTTAEGAYVGEQGAGNSIVQILKVIYNDIEKDQRLAKKENDESIEAFNEMEKTTNAQINKENADITDQETKISGLNDSIGDKKTDNLSRKSVWGAKMDEWNAMAPGCHFLSVNFVTRKSNREAEVAGLQKAKAILNGAVFDAPDPNRAIVPGDAFLQGC